MRSILLWFGLMALTVRQVLFPKLMFAPMLAVVQVQMQVPFSNLSPFSSREPYFTFRCLYFIASLVLLCFVLCCVVLV